MRRRALIIALAAVTGLAVALPTAVQARGHHHHHRRHRKNNSFILGLIENNAEMFSQSDYQRLGIRTVRMTTAWNSIYTDPQGLEAWIQAAQDAHAQPLIAFTHADGDECYHGRPHGGHPCTLPSVRHYKRAMRAFHRKYPRIHTIQPWNEENASSQPTYSIRRGAKRAAQYYNADVRIFGHRNKITAADLLAQGPRQLRRWARHFLYYAHGRPRLWGVHNYPDLNRPKRHNKGLKAALKVLPGKIWLTEAAGLKSLVIQATGRQDFAPSEHRQVRGMKQLIRVSRRFRQIRRVYWYSYYPGSIFDSGLVNAQGTPRKVYYTFDHFRRYF
jgi:hypothetical protein